MPEMDHDNSNIVSAMREARLLGLTHFSEAPGRNQKRRLRRRLAEHSFGLSIIAYVSLAIAGCVTLGLAGCQTLFAHLSHDTSHQPGYLFHVTWAADAIIGGCVGLTFFVAACVVRYRSAGRDD